MATEGRSVLFRPNTRTNARDAEKWPPYGSIWSMPTREYGTVVVFDQHRTSWLLARVGYGLLG